MKRLLSAGRSAPQRPMVEVGSEWRHREHTKNVRRVMSKWMDGDGRSMVTYCTPGDWEDSMTERGFLRTHTPANLTAPAQQASSPVPL